MTLRDAITEGLNNADQQRVFSNEYMDRVPFETVVADLTDHIMAAVATAVRRGDFTVFNTPGTGHPGFRTPGSDPTSLDFSEYDEYDRTIAPAPVATIDATDVISMLAASAHRMNPVVARENTDHTAMGIEVIVGEDNHRAFRQFLFAVQPLFGVRTRVKVTNGETTFAVGGLRDDVRAFRLVVETFARVADTLPDESTVDQEVLWATIGAMAAGTDRALTQIDAATDRYENATTYMRATLGPARTLPRANAVESGQVRDLAVAALADAATTL